MSNYLTDRRKELGLTMKQVAELVGVSEATVSRWESGQIANMRRDKINSYAKALQVRPSFIMAGETQASFPLPQDFQPVPSIKKSPALDGLPAARLSLRRKMWKNMTAFRNTGKLILP